jgi:probable phosphoglycerate mutase
VTAGSGGGPLLVLVRHGQTDANLAKALDSRPPGPPLNEVGQAQAAALAVALEASTDGPVAAVYTSVALRAQQTAAPLAARLGLPVEVVDGVHEVFCGDLEGRSDQAAREVFEQVNRDWAHGELGRPLPGGESAEQLRARFLPTVARLWARHADRSDGLVVLVSHGAAIRLAVAALIGGYAETRYVPNAGRVVLAPLPGPPDGVTGGSGVTGVTGADATEAPGRWVLSFWDDGPPVPGDSTGGVTA